MSQNSEKEIFHIPDPEALTITSNELKISAIYNSETNKTSFYDQSEAERAISPESQELFDIADRIDAARKYHLANNLLTYEQ